jgi:hypothetical protein
MYAFDCYMELYSVCKLTRSGHLACSAAHVKCPPIILWGFFYSWNLWVSACKDGVMFSGYGPIIQKHFFVKPGYSIVTEVCIWLPSTAVREGWRRWQPISCRVLLGTDTAGRHSNFPSTFSLDVPIQCLLSSVKHKYLTARDQSI